jgi:hypothetical protein
VPGTFYPWLDGPQIFLGVRVSQVEVVACLLREKQLSIVSNAGGSRDDGETRAKCGGGLLLPTASEDKAS